MRIALVTRHYPPAVSGGARRPFLLARALREAGAEVFVVAPGLPEGEPGLVAPHPHRDPPTAAPRARSLRDHAREILLWPDPDIRWTMRAARAAAAALPFRPDWIWTTSPPESAHAAGVFLKRRTGARWLADFRDHWLDRPHRRERAALHRRIGEKAIARLWLRQADAVTAVDRFVAGELAGLGAAAPEILPHFAPDLMPPPAALPPESINIVHAGSIALSDPEARIDDLIDAFVAARDRNPRLRLHLVGRLTDAEVEAARRPPAGEATTIIGVRTFEETLAIERAADALVLVGSAKTRVPPSKIAEYLATDAPIIVCGEGAWRKDERIEDRDPAEAMAGLVKNGKRARLNRAPTARESAARLLDLLKRPR